MKYEIMAQIAAITGFTMSCGMFTGLWYGITKLFNLSFHIAAPLIIWFILISSFMALCKAAGDYDEAIERFQNKKS